MLRTLIAIRLRALAVSMFNRGRADAKPVSGGKKALFALLAVYVIVCLFASVGLLFSSVAGPLIEMGLSWLVMAVAALLSLGVCFVGSVFITQQQLFEAKDNELLLSMPVPPRYILISRLLLILLVNLLFSAFVCLPAFVVFCVKAPAVTAAMVVCFIIAFFLCALLSTAISCLCGWLVALLTSKMRRKNLFTTVFLLVFFFGYMYLYTNLQGYAQKLIAAGAEFADALLRAFPPAVLFGRAAAEGSFASLGLFALCCIIPFAVACFALERSFLRIATTKRGAARVKYRERELTVSSARGALLRRELQRFFSMPMYIFNCGLGAFMSLILAGALIIKGPELLGAMGLSPAFSAYLPAALGCALCFCTIMNDITAPSVSLEGKRLWILRSAPVRAQDVISAKLGTELVVALPPLLIAAVVSSVVLRLSLADAVLVTVLAVAAQLFNAAFGLAVNLRLPRFDWLNETVVVKNSASVMVTVFAGMGYVILLAGAFVLLAGAISVTAYMAAVAVLFILASALLIRWLYTRGARIFDTL